MKTEYITEGGVVHEVYTYPNGSTLWYVEGKRHREGGPAIEWDDGTREWWVEDERIDHSLWDDGHDCEVFSSVEVKL